MRDSDLQATALRYAAGDLSAAEAAAFEQLLAEDQNARDALSEAVRLSAAALGQASPAPDRSFRSRIRARLGLSYRGPLAWASLGAAVAAACALVAVSAADRTDPAEEAIAAPVAPAAVTGVAPLPELTVPPDAVVTTDQPVPPGDERSVAEIWADLSNHDGVEKARDDEMRWRQRMRDLSNPNHVSASAKADGP